MVQALGNATGGFGNATGENFFHCTAPMDPPAEAEFSTCEALIQAAQDHGKAHGYAVTIKRSCKRDNTTTLGCDRGGQYRARNGITSATRQRSTSTCLQGCPFTLLGKMKGDV